MKDAASDRKSKKSANDELAQNLAAFTLPESLPTSEIQFPVLAEKSSTADWSEIVSESDKKVKEILDYIESKKEPTPKSPFISFLMMVPSPDYPEKRSQYFYSDTECDYLSNEVFIHLLPAVEETLAKAKIWNAFTKPKCFFNGIDHITQVLWNNNPRYPERKGQNLHIFNMPWVREELKNNPRPCYPKSWLWPDNYAATVIQKCLRQYFVVRDEEVQEMREFWRKLELEKLNPGIMSNPLLAKKFASVKELSSSTETDT